MGNNIQGTRTCERCKTATPLNKVKLFPKDKETNLLVCEKCHQELSRPRLVSRTKPLPQAEYAKYFCTRCKYPFRADSLKVDVIYNLKCPYCGKDDKLLER